MQELGMVVSRKRINHAFFYFMEYAKMRMALICNASKSKSNNGHLYVRYAYLYNSIESTNLITMNVFAQSSYIYYYCYIPNDLGCFRFLLMPGAHVRGGAHE